MVDDVAGISSIRSREVHHGRTVGGTQWCKPVRRTPWAHCVRYSMGKRCEVHLSTVTMRGIVDPSTTTGNLVHWYTGTLVHWCTMGAHTCGPPPCHDARHGGHHHQARGLVQAVEQQAVLHGGEDQLGGHVGLGHRADVGRRPGPSPQPHWLRIVYQCGVNRKDGKCKVVK